jgi:hypothetical protein
MPRLSNQPARERLAAVLGRIEPASAREIAKALDVSTPTALRILAEQKASLVVLGNARRRRYALRRALRGEASAWPVYAIDEAGRAHAAGEMALIAPAGSHLAVDAHAWPVPDESRDGWWPGLPYPLFDMRPQGFMGRGFARRHAGALRLDPDPTTWSEDDIVVALARAGADLSGNLMVGHAALAEWQRTTLNPPRPIAEAQRGAAYVALAEQALADGAAGSSAGGEFPKFTTLRERTGSRTPHVIVKFSGADDSAAVRRWSDLLVCEHLALETVARDLGLRSSRSDIVQHAGRTFLEVERFDRHGSQGRSALVSLETIDATFLGSSSTQWPELAKRLEVERLLDASDVARIEILWWFGKLIRNTDMHLGNLSFEPVGTLRIAPVYDMLPMAYAPLSGGEVPPRPFDVALPMPEQRERWLAACTAALEFWRRAASDVRIGGPFRAVCADNAAALARLRSHA